MYAELITTKPTSLEQVEIAEFLSRRDIRYRPDADYMVRCYDGERLTGCGALAGCVLKYIAVDERLAGEGICASIVSELIAHAMRCGLTHLFLYTKPENARIFVSLGFYEICATDNMLMMENKRNGIDSFIASLPKAHGNVGAVVLNANPFTNGHLSLVTQAAARCDALYVFVVSEDRSDFSCGVRLKLVRDGVAHIKNAIVCKSCEYLVSYATFPDYFIKDIQRVDDIRADMDIALFAKRIAKPLGITTRFVGSEPFSPLTAAYNHRMAELLPQEGIELVEFTRTDGISASKVRALMADGELEKLRTMVPETTFEYIRDHIG
ncbi:MAG: [citrate (pro-3S)-lyase] ligase [Clostridia bacterium]